MSRTIHTRERHPAEPKRRQPSAPVMYDAASLERKTSLGAISSGQVVEIARSTKRRPSGRVEENRLVMKIHDLSERYP